MGYDLTDGCSIHLDKQIKVFKEQLRHYAGKELWSTVWLFIAETVWIPGKPQSYVWTPWVVSYSLNTEVLTEYMCIVSTGE